MSADDTHPQTTPGSQEHPDAPGPMPLIREPESFKRTRPPEATKKRRWIWPVAVVATIALAVGGVTVWRLTAKPPLELAYESCKDVDSIMQTMVAGQSIDTTSEHYLSSQATLADLASEYIEGVLSVEDNGKTLVVSTKPQKQDPLGFGSELSLNCVFEVLGTPTRVKQSVSTTRALDGRQTDSWERFNVQWGYHPDNGLSMIISEE
ncbi:hypothetical protein [Schaalia hyovaginalis]|uniref:hypothetical protein n=1 Tax=Schaalia hyovaginalis TaxID=29316 RepID=UPI0012B30E2E|nr:hypothetical protein [Schaalia hyovaginalis]MCI7513146.1 hypothetical protein [Schaalia hyovaginalis]MST63816.1 hypothetical protein [Schaalia hyovaginalis]